MQISYNPLWHKLIERNMKKELSEMSLEELWELFPIFLVKPNDKWDRFYDETEIFPENRIV